MSARLNWIADVAIDGDTLTRVQIIVRKEVATVSRVGAVIAEKAGVVAVEAPESRARLIRFDDHTLWQVTLPAAKPGGCGCS